MTGPWFYPDYVLAPNQYCPLCGVLLFLDHDPPTPLHRQQPWFGELRGIIVHDDLTASLTGLGVFSRRGVLSAPLDSTISYMNAPPMKKITLFQRVGPCWGFACHNSCWSLLCGRLALVGIDKDIDIAESVAKLLRATPCSCFSVFQFGHDYGIAAATHKPFGRPRAVDLSLALYADPSDIPCLDDLEMFAPEDPFPASAENTILLSNQAKTMGQSAFHRLWRWLPVEIIYEILSYLTLEQVSTLRLVCRELAVLARWETLPPSFWRSRFMLGQRLAFVLPDLSSRRDWLRLCYGVQFSLRSKSAALINRKRIWHLLETIAVHVESDITSPKELCGLQVDLACPESNPQIFQATEPQSGLLTRFPITASLPGQVLPPPQPQQTLDNPGHVEQCRVGELPCWNSERDITVGISTVHVGGRGFISGIHHLTHQNPSRRMGYCTKTPQMYTELPPMTRLEHIEVAFFSEGLCGIRFACSGGTPTKWLGQAEGADVARGILHLPNEVHRSLLAIGLDSLKVVSIGLAQESSPVPDGCANGTNKLVPDSSFLRSHLWIPDVPQNPKLSLSSMHPHQPFPYFTLLDIDFGGPDGIFLSSLTRIVVHMLCDLYPIIGIEFFYTDRVLKFGHGGESELSFIIDGPGGERVTDVEVLMNDARPSGSSMNGVKISTSRGRSMCFFSIALSGSPSPLPLQLPRDSIITGLVATQLAIARSPIKLDRRTRKCFAQLGIQGQRQHEQALPVYQEPNKNIIRDLAESQKQDREFLRCIRVKDYGCYRTHASLLNVRRIQASFGLPGRSRSASCLSGLKLDYWDCCASTIVGQWMSGERGSGFELAPDEQFRRIIIWLEKVGKSVEVPGLDQGTVLAMKFNTTQGRSVEFGDVGNQQLVGNCMQQQYEAGASESLVAILWILNSCHDRIRCDLSNDSSQRPPLCMVPEQPPPLNHVQELLFHRVLDNGAPDQVAAIEAYFHGGIITGFGFLYQSGHRRTLGNTTNDCHSISVPEGGKITRFSAIIIAHTLRKLEFQFEQGTPGAEQERRILGDNNLDSCSSLDQYNGHLVWCAGGSSTGETETPGTTVKNGDNYMRLHVFPSRAVFAGVYVSCQDFTCLGVLFENPQSSAPVSS